MNSKRLNILLGLVIVVLIGIVGYVTLKNNNQNSNVEQNSGKDPSKGSSIAGTVLAATLVRSNPVKTLEVRRDNNQIFLVKTSAGQQVASIRLRQTEENTEDYWHPNSLLSISFQFSTNDSSNTDSDVLLQENITENGMVASVSNTTYDINFTTGKITPLYIFSETGGNPIEGLTSSPQVFSILGNNDLVLNCNLKQNSVSNFTVSDCDQPAQFYKDYARKELDTDPGIEQAAQADRGDKYFDSTGRVMKPQTIPADKINPLELFAYMDQGKFVVRIDTGGVSDGPNFGKVLEK